MIVERERERDVQRAKEWGLRDDDTVKVES